MTTLYMVAARSCDQGIRGEIAQRLGSDLMKMIGIATQNVVVDDGCGSLVNDDGKTAVYQLVSRALAHEDEGLLHDIHHAQLFREGYQAERSASALIRITIERV